MICPQRRHCYQWWINPQTRQPTTTTITTTITTTTTTTTTTTSATTTTTTLASSALARVISTEHKSVLLGQVDTFRAIANLGQGQVAHAHSNAVNQAPCTTCGPAKGQQASAEVLRATSASTCRPAPVASKVEPARWAKNHEAETKGRGGAPCTTCGPIKCQQASNLGLNPPNGARRQQSDGLALRIKPQRTPRSGRS